jgi:PhzF family phenazine biosynthesis protein
MLTCPFFWVDAFNMGPFTGNPAGVCSLQNWAADEFLQKIAHQNGLAETAFFVPIAPARFHLRWFTPSAEIDLCGHATLASAHVLINELKLASNAVTFETLSGELGVTLQPNGALALDFPSRPPESVATATLPDGLLDALGLKPTAVNGSGRARDWLIEVTNEDAVRELSPDFSALLALNISAVIVTARGRQVDFVSRFFAPSYGVNEDPVTGSAHCTLTPAMGFFVKRDSIIFFRLH